MEKIEMAKNWVSRIWLYTTLKWIAVQIFAKSVRCISATEFTEVFETGKAIGFSITITEILSVGNNQQNMLVILMRSLATNILKYNVFEQFQILYVLFKLFELKIQFDLKYALFSLFKIVLNPVVQWAILNMNIMETVINNYIDPSAIRTALSFTQMDAIEFNTSNVYTAFAIAGGMIIEMLQYSNIFEALLNRFVD